MYIFHTFNKNNLVGKRVLKEKKKRTSIVAALKRQISLCLHPEYRAFFVRADRETRSDDPSWDGLGKSHAEVSFRVKWQSKHM